MVIKDRVIFFFQQPVAREPSKVIYTTAGLNLPVPSIDRAVSILVWKLYYFSL